MDALFLLTYHLERSLLIGLKAPNGDHLQPHRFLHYITFVTSDPELYPTIENQRAPTHPQNILFAHQRH